MTTTSTEPFETPLKIAQLMSGFDRPWFVAGGWAIDLFLGRVRRKHKDLDFTIFRRDQLALQNHLAAYDLKKIVGPDGAEYPETWQQGEWLELPVFQVFVSIGPDGFAELEVLFSETEGEEWWWRKNPQVRQPLSLLGRRSPLGVPYLSPEIVLLHKSRHIFEGSMFRENNQADFDDTIDALDPEGRTWLKSTLETWYPDHPWLERLQSYSQQKEPR
jgi:Aminoglycoside-2''-adenylyltransferase